jgi:Domain of unknown function (DUF4186)
MAASESKLEPLNIKCTSSDCENGLHCFLQTQEMKADNQSGPCRSCGAELVDWSRVHKRDPLDADYAFKALKYELVRHHAWHLEIDQKAVNHARRKGVLRMRSAVEKRIRQSVAAAKPFRDGGQTPWQGRAYYYAQHATASCCRKCIEEWHGIPSGRELTEAEIGYLADLVIRYIEERMPYLTMEGETVPRLRREELPASRSTS